jgi:hypothetical protein
MQLIIAAAMRTNMKSTHTRGWLLVVLVMLLSGTLFADSSGVLYPGWGTTLNAKLVYFSVRISAGDHIQTANDPSVITFGGAELEMAANSDFVVGDSFLLGCGTIVVRSGKAEVSDGKTSSALAAGEILHSSSPGCGDSLPDAPSAVRNQHDFVSTRKTGKRYDSAPPAAIGGLYGNFKAANWPFWTVNGAMFGSTLVAAEFTYKCLEAGACTSVPDSFHSRKVMLAAGAPALLGVSYLDYYLKSKGKRWWFVPSALVIAGDIVVAEHAARYSHSTATPSQAPMPGMSSKSTNSNPLLRIEP